MHPSKRAQGGALLTALFIMTLVAIVATAMSTRLQLDIYRTRLITNHDKLYLASQAVTFWAMSELSNKENQFTQINRNKMVANFPKNLESIDAQIKLSGGIYDLQARYNLNNLVNRKSLSSFVLLVNHVINLPQNDRINLALAIHDWVQNYDLSRGKDNYTSFYLAQQPPYYPSHQAFKSVSELRLVKDVSASLYLTLEPYVTVLPEATPININTAPKPVLLSLGNGLNESQVNELIMARGTNGITNLKDIRELLKKLDLPNDQITIESQYFLCVAKATSEDRNLTVYTLLKRSRDQQKKLTVSIIRQSINSY